MKIGVMYGNPETTTGGNALKFYASIRLEVRKVTSIKQGEDVMGNTVRVKVVKNKVAAPFKEVELDIMFGEGISREGSLLDVGVNLEIVEKAGSWFAYNGERIGQGKENVKAFLKANHPIAAKLEKEIRAKVKATADALIKPEHVLHIKEKEEFKSGKEK
jgi:recombination protein RecA